MTFLEFLTNNSYLFLIALIILIISVIILCIFSRKTLSDFIAVYCGVLFLIIFGIYSVGYANDYGYYKWDSFFRCIHSSIKMFGFEINFDIIQIPLKKDSVYATSLYLATFMAGITMVVGLLELFTSSALNKIFTFFKMMGVKQEIVLGYSEGAISYCKNNKKSVLWIDPTINKITKEERRKLYKDNIIYIHKPFTAKNLKLATLLVFDEIFIVCFQKDNEHLNSIFNTLRDFKYTDKKYKFHIQANSEHLDFINTQLAENCKNKGKIMAMTFDYHELISRNFSMEHNLAYYLPSDYIKEGCIVDGKNINVVILGYGKTGKAILKSILLNNQFVEKYGDFYRCKKINFDIYDVEEDAFDDSLLMHIENYGKLCENDFFGFDERLEPFEMTAQINHHVYNVKTDPEGTFYSSIKNNKDTFTFYVVALSESTDNLLVAEKIARKVNGDSSVIFYNVDSLGELKINHANCIQFGFKKEIFSHKNIANESLFEFAQARSKVYGQKTFSSIGFYESPIIEKISNIYDVINHKFKLNLLGLDYVKDETKTSITKEEYLKYHPTAPLNNYEEYFKVNIVNALIYQEHLRWCMLYFIYDFKGMKLDELYLVEYTDNKNVKSKRVVHKDTAIRKHACLTSFKGLDILHHYELNLLLKANVNKTIGQVETYKHDIKLDKAYDILTELGYKIVKLEK